MNGKQLKNSILQWAIQGKLVPQDPNDEPASVLLERIRQEKERLIKEKKIKRDKNASIIYRGEDNSYYEKFLASGEVKCIDEEIPFEIPSSWEWSRLGDICSYLHRGKSPKYGEHKFLPIIAQKCNQWDKIYTDRCLFSSKDYIEKYKEEQFVQKGDIIINSTGGGTVGRTGYIDSYVFTNFDRFVVDSHVTLVRSIYPIASKYVYYFLISPLIQIGLEDRCSGSTNQIELGTTTITSYLVPIPPIKEQYRIINQFQKVLPLLERYSTNQIAQDKLNAEINIQLKKSILQEAIQGKLVPQIEKDGSAQELLEQIRQEKQRLVKEGTLKKSALTDSVIYKGDDNKYWEKSGENRLCIDNEIPFDIPSSWSWVRLNDICSFIHRGKSPKYSMVKKYPVVAQKCNQWSGFSIEKAKFIEPQSISSYKEEYFLQNEDLMWNSTGLGTLGRMAIYYEELNPYELAVADSHVTVIRPYKQYIAPEYLYYYFASNTVQSVIEEKSDGSTKQKELATKTVQGYLIPLPPLAEQYRIIQRIKSVTSIMS